MTNTLNERKREILFAVINDYITTATPVASKTISKKYRIELSPATIRSVMADLEKMGLLYHPHTSAGRIPTTVAFKYYADTLIQVKTISDKEKEIIEKRCSADPKDVEELMKETSLILSNISNYAGIVLAPKKNRAVFKHIQFIRLSDRKLLAVLVSKKGIVQNRIIEVDEEIAFEELEQIHNYLNSILKDLTIDQVREKILCEMEKDKIKYDRLLSKAIRLGHKTISETKDEQEIFVEGETNLIDQPEFSDTPKLKQILKALERKTMLIDILERTVNAEGIQIFIGTEAAHPEFRDLSLIMSSFKGEDGVLGTIGVVGPTRMNYQRIIPIVDYTAKFLTKLFTED